jgi:hypothetical protein
MGGIGIDQLMYNNNLDMMVTQTANRMDSQIQWGHRGHGSAEVICALHRAGTTRLHIWMVLVVMMMVTKVLMRSGRKTLSFEFLFFSHLLASFAIMQYPRTVWDMVWGSICWRTVSVTDG